MARRAPVWWRRLMMAGRISRRDQVHHLDQGVEGRAGGVLERVADGVADDGGLVGLGSLAAFVAVLDVLLGVVPGPTGVGQEVGHELAGEDGPDQKGPEGEVVDAETDDDRAEDGQQGRGGQLPLGRRGADGDDLPVLGLLGVVHDPGVLAELAAHLLDHGAGRPAHRPDGQGREDEGDRAADQDADERRRVGDVDRGLGQVEAGRCRAGAA